MIQSTRNKLFPTVYCLQTLKIYCSPKVSHDVKMIKRRVFCFSDDYDCNADPLPVSHSESPKENKNTFQNVCSQTPWMDAVRGILKLIFFIYSLQTFHERQNGNRSVRQTVHVCTVHHVGCCFGNLPNSASLLPFSLRSKTSDQEVVQFAFGKRNPVRNVCISFVLPATGKHCLLRSVVVAGSGTLASI